MTPNRDRAMHPSTARSGHGRLVSRSSTTGACSTCAAMFGDGAMKGNSEVEDATTAEDSGCDLHSRRAAVVFSMTALGFAFCMC